MSGWKRVLGYGFLSWLIPFAVSIAVFPLKAGSLPLFDNLMAITVAATGVVLGSALLRRGGPWTAAAAIGAGAVWWAINVVLDLLMVSSGPMKMSPGDYFQDIGLAYAVYPIVTAGLQRAARGSAPATA